MNILIVSDHYPPFIGGAHRQTQLLGQELRQRGHEVSVATSWQVGLPAQHDDAGVTVYRLKQLRTWWPRGKKPGEQQHQPPYPDPITTWQLRRLIDLLRPDVVHAYGWISYSCAIALQGKNIPMLLSGRDYGYSCATRTLAYKDRVLCSGPGPRKCVECSMQHYGATKGLVSAIGVNGSRGLLRRKVSGFHSVSVYVQEVTQRDFLGTAGAMLPRAVIPSFREDDADAGHGDDATIQRYLEQLPSEPFILFVGALRVVKGVKQLLAAYERLENPPPLVLIGTIESDTPREFPPGVVVLQKVPHRAVLAAWERALFGVVPSLWPEPLGSVVYEGMSRGKAMIGTTPGGHSDMIVDDETGRLVPSGDVDALVMAMRQLIGDGAVRERFGHAARERAELFTAGKAVPQFERLYRQLVTDATPQQLSAMPAPDPR